MYSDRKEGCNTDVSSFNYIIYENSLEKQDTEQVSLKKLKRKTAFYFTRTSSCNCIAYKFHKAVWEFNPGLHHGAHLCRQPFRKSRTLVTLSVHLPRWGCMLSGWGEGEGSEYSLFIWFICSKSQVKNSPQDSSSLPFLCPLSKTLKK